MALNEGFDRGGPDASKPGPEALKGQNRKKGKQEWKNGKGGVTLLATQHTEWAPRTILIAGASPRELAAARSGAGKKKKKNPQKGVMGVCRKEGGEWRGRGRGGGV